MITGIIGKEVVRLTDNFNMNVGTVMRHVNQNSVEVHWRKGGVSREFTNGLYPVTGKWES